MKQVFRAPGVVILAAAVLHASAGLCFCHRGPADPARLPATQGCCHGPATSDGLVMMAAGSCCHVESAESSAAPEAAVKLAPPATVFSLPPSSHSPAAADSRAGTALSGFSPPALILRI